MRRILKRTIATPTGPLTISATGDDITAVTWSTHPAQDDSPLLREATEQVHAYFDGQLTRFDLPLALPDRPILRAVCERMLAIPFGETRTYGDLARSLGKPAQAIGQACGRNPIALIIPCHRILARNGLGGFSGGTGLETKIQLLKHEGAASLLI